MRKNRYSKAKLKKILLGITDERLRVPRVEQTSTMPLV